jgi:hypothetical protein
MKSKRATSPFSYRLALAVTLAIVLNSSARAALTDTPSEYDGAVNGGTGIDALASNLVTDATLSSTDFSAFQDASISVLQDGTLGSSSSAAATQTALDTNPWDLTITFDTSAATGSITGYTLSNIKAFAGWNADFASQDYTLSYTTVGGTTVSLGTYFYNDTNSTDSATTTETSLTAALDAPIAVGVASLQFAFGDAPAAAAGTSSYGAGQTGAYEEIEAFGTATVSTPEPSTWALMLVGGLGVLAFYQRARSRA